MSDEAADLFLSYLQVPYRHTDTAPKGNRYLSFVSDQFPVFPMDSGHLPESKRNAIVVGTRRLVEERLAIKARSQQFIFCLTLFLKTPHRLLSSRNHRVLRGEIFKNPLKSALSTQT